MILKTVFYIVMALSTTLLCAQTSEINKLKNRRQQIIAEIENTNKQLQQTKQTFEDLKKRLSLTERQINARKEIISLLEQETKAIEIQQQITENEIKSLEQELKERQRRYANATNAIMYRNQGKNKLLYILSGRSLSEALRRMKFLKEYAQWLSNEADLIKEKSNELHLKKSDLELQRKQKIVTINQKDYEQKKLIQEEINYKKEVAQAQKQEKTLQKALAQKQRQANQLNQQINKLIAQEVAKQKREAERRAREQQRKNPKQRSSTPPKVDDTTPLSNSFQANKGRLPSPITGQFAIVSRFGTHKQGNITINNNGIDLQGQAGAEARTVFDGEVSRIVSFPGFNNCIIVRHGKYYTFYGNIQHVYVKQGQRVKTGESLGKIYTDSETEVTKMHFQLWNETNKQDPYPWIRK